MQTPLAYRRAEEAQAAEPYIKGERRREGCDPRIIQEFEKFATAMVPLEPGGYPPDEEAMRKFFAEEKNLTIQ